jgi:hypothetical protein
MHGLFQTDSVRDMAQLLVSDLCLPARHGRLGFLNNESRFSSNVVRNSFSRKDNISTPKKKVDSETVAARSIQTYDCSVAPRLVNENEKLYCNENGAQRMLSP